KIPVRTKPESRSAYSAANPWSVSRFTVSKVEIPRMGGLTSASALARASETVGLKPWRLAGATSPSVATGSLASAPISKDAGLGVAEAYVSERYTGTQAEASSAAVNAKTVPSTAMALAEANFLKLREIVLSSSRQLQRPFRS